MSKAHLHINGTDYELAQDFNGTSDPELERITAQAKALVSGGPSMATFRVSMHGTATDLHVAADNVTTSAVYLAKPRTGFASAV